MPSETESARMVSISWLQLLAQLAITLLVSFPARAQEAITFYCTFKAVYETAESDNPTKSNFEKQFWPAPRKLTRVES